LVVSQLSPVNPTLVNGVPLSTPRRLRTGDRIEIADGIEFRVELFDFGEDIPTEPRRVNERRMYAILHADVVAYSRLVEKDDAATARQFEAFLDIIRYESESVGGHIEHVAGDGILILFTSASSAVASAVGWQQKVRSLNRELPLERRMEFRVGINSGDVLITPSGSAHGDAVNIAARIQSLAPPGGILVAGVVRDQLQGHENFRFQYVRTSELKNLSREVRIYFLEF
jgi:class 3 adenylate cyclase